MKKIKLLALCTILTGVGIVASSSRPMNCTSNNDCPLGMICVNNECINSDFGGGGDRIPCYSSLTDDEHRSEVDCSTCSRIFKQRPSLLATQSLCTTHGRR